MERLHLLLAVSAAWIVLFSGRPTAAQYTPRYRPSRRPSFSPHFQLFREATGPLDPYHEYVRPEMRRRETLNRQNRELYRQGSGLKRQGTELRGLGSRMSSMEREMQARPTGAASTFMNYSHYYQFGATSGRSARSWQPPPPSRGGGSYSGF